MMRLVRTGSAVKRLKRFRQVINVFVKYGFGEAMGRIRVWEACNVRRHVLRRKAECSIELTTPQRLAAALEPAVHERHPDGLGELRVSARTCEDDGTADER